MKFTKYTCSCIICRSKITTCNLDKHYNSKICRSGKKYQALPKPNSLNCSYCNKLCKNLNSFRNHERCCPKNPNKHIICTKEKYEERDMIIWNKGLKKEDHPSIEIYANKNSKIMRGRKGTPHTEEFKNKQSKNAKRRGLGGVRQSKKILYNDVLLGSTYEYDLAVLLDKIGIKWSIPKRIYYKDFTGKERSYSPDIYLPDYDLYLDPKNDFLINNINPRLGFKDTDKIKWVMEQNNIRVEILSKDQINENYILKLIG